MLLKDDLPVVNLSSAAAKAAQGNILLPRDLSTTVAEPAIGAANLLGKIWQGCWRGDSWTSASMLRLSWVFALATLCSWLGIVLSRQSEGVATIWLSNGLIFGLLITQPKRLWLVYFLAGLTADTLADLLYGDPFRVAIGVSLANSIEVVTSCLLLTLWFDSPLDLSKRRSLVGFLLISVLATYHFFNKDQVTALANLSRWAFLLTFAGVGLRTNFNQMRKQGLRPFAVGAIGEVAIAIFTLGLVVGAEKLFGL